MEDLVLQANKEKYHIFSPLGVGYNSQCFKEWKFRHQQWRRTENRDKELLRKGKN